MECGFVGLRLAIRPSCTTNRTISYSAIPSSDIETRLAGEHAHAFPDALGQSRRGVITSGLLLQGRRHTSHDMWVAALRILDCGDRFWSERVTRRSRQFAYHSADESTSRRLPRQVAPVDVAPPTDRSMSSTGCSCLSRLFVNSPTVRHMFDESLSLGLPTRCRSSPVTKESSGECL